MLIFFTNGLKITWSSLHMSINSLQKKANKDLKFCLYHRYVHHPTADYWTLQLNRKIQDKTLLLSPEHQEGPTPKERGGLQLSCCLTQQTESCDKSEVDQEEFATMKYEKSTSVDPKIVAKEDLEVIKLSNDFNISKLVSTYTSLSTVERNNLIGLLKEHQDIFCLST